MDLHSHLVFEVTKSETPLDKQVRVSSGNFGSSRDHHIRTVNIPKVSICIFGRNAATSSISVHILYTGSKWEVQGAANRSVT